MTKMPKASRFGRFCSLKDIPDENGNSTKPLVSIFNQRMLKGWWPLYKHEHGKRTFGVGFYFLRVTYCLVYFDQV